MYTKEDLGARLQSKSHWRSDFGESHLGRNPHDDGYIGRRIDIMGRSIPFTGDDKESVLAWLRGDSHSASNVIKRPVIGLFPEHHLGTVIWPGMTIRWRIRKSLLSSTPAPPTRWG
jgi:hypothetical protein